jgi:hypothetical protein
MQGLDFLKTIFFRLLATVLLTLCTGLVFVPESSTFSADKTFVKAHAPADNFVIKADDREGVDEDRAIDVQSSADFSTEGSPWVAFGIVYRIGARPLPKLINQPVYLVHRKLQI